MTMFEASQARRHRNVEQIILETAEAKLCHQRKQLSHEFSVHHVKTYSEFAHLLLFFAQSVITPL